MNCLASDIAGRRPHNETDQIRHVLRCPKTPEWNTISAKIERSSGSGGWVVLAYGVVSPNNDLISADTIRCQIERQSPHESIKTHLCSHSMRSCLRPARRGHSAHAHD